MILLKIFDIKNTMAALLLKEDYDEFFLEDAKVNTFMKLQLSGFRNMRFYDEGERAGLSEYLLWKEAKPFLFSFIKGEKTPDSFQISLRAPDKWHGELAGGQEKTVDCFLHFRFENEELSVVTGCSYYEFTMDKEAEHEWDLTVKRFFDRKGIAYEEPLS